MDTIQLIRESSQIPRSNEVRFSIGDTQPQLSASAESTFARVDNAHKPKPTDLSKVKKSSKEFSNAFKNAKLPFKTSPVNNQTEAEQRLLEIFGKEEGQDVIRYEILSEDTIVAETNELLSQIKDQAQTGKYDYDPKTVGHELITTYGEYKKNKLEESLVDFNHNTDKTGAFIQQDSKNPLHLAFNSGVEGSPIEVFQFKNYDLAIAAIKGLEQDIKKYAEELKANPLAALAQAPVSNSIRSNYSSMTSDMAYNIAQSLVHAA